MEGMAVHVGAPKYETYLDKLNVVKQNVRL